MIRLRRAAERGHFDHGWLDTRHTFSFADYYDPAHMGFRALRVMNEDRVRPGHGFGTHGHRDMEILTCVLEGALRHRDSLGGGAVLGPGEFQRITAGTGVRHSEFNPSADEPVHFYQVWLLPERNGLAPGYEQRAFPALREEGRWHLVASRDGRDGSLTVHQDVGVLLGALAGGASLDYGLAVVPGITGLIDRLGKAGLVRREQSRADRRVFLVSITARARRLLAGLDEPVLALHRKLLGHLSADELLELIRLLEKARTPWEDG